MTTFQQFQAKAKMRHDFSDQIQVRYPHPNGEPFDAWVSGEEVMMRLNAQSRERLIKSFSQKNWRQAREAIKDELDKGKKKARRSFKDRLAGAVSDTVGGNIFGDTLSDNIRGRDSNADLYDEEKKMWQNRLQDDDFRAIVFELAWINLEGTFPDEEEAEPDDWV